MSGTWGLNKGTFFSENELTPSFANIERIIRNVLQKCTDTYDSSEVSGGDSVR